MVPTPLTRRPYRYALGSEDLIRSTLLLALMLFGPLAVAEETAQPFVCCDRTDITATVNAYLDLHEVLATPSSTDRDAEAAVEALSESVGSQRGLDTPDRRAIQALKKSLEDTSTPSLSAIREAFDPISRQVIFLALRHPGGDLRIAEAWCPHVGPWLQRNLGELRGPYGSSCGRWQ
jgi:hypothetical protein